jgi:CRP/FNR family transcriptional regulator, cyclic AMP receptor protein
MDEAPGTKTFWALLGAEERAALAREARPHVFADGATVCLEGEPSTHVFILMAGWVKVTSAVGDGREMLQTLRGQGDVVGEIAGEVTGYRTATIRAAGTVRSLIIGAKRFGAFLETHAGAGRAYRRAMTERQRAANEAQRIRALTSGGQRLAHLLLDLAERHGDDADHGTTSAPPLSQGELASLIGASRATVTRTLSQWRSRHLVDIQPRHITVIDRAALRRIAGRSPGQ